MLFSVKRPIFLLANAFCFRVVRVQRAVVFGPQLQLFIAREALPGLRSKEESRKPSATVDECKCQLDRKITLHHR
jgi:hypothetical protein